jgi:hypothetical protein
MTTQEAQQFVVRQASVAARPLPLCDAEMRREDVVLWVATGGAVQIGLFGEPGAPGMVAVFEREFPYGADEDAGWRCTMRLSRQVAAAGCLGHQ